MVGRLGEAGSVTGGSVLAGTVGDAIGEIVARGGGRHVYAESSTLGYISEDEDDDGGASCMSSDSP
jgi:hypothetical protein